MCCWSTKLRSAVAAPRRGVFSAVNSQQLAEQWQRVNSSTNSSSSSSMQRHELCTSPKHPCPETAEKYAHYCENGVCCIILGEEHCSCHLGFTGDRCDTHMLPSVPSVSMSHFVEAVSVVSIVAVIVVILLIVLLVLFYLRARHIRLEQRKEAKQQQEVTVNVSQMTCTVEPGFSWREVSVKRQSHKSMSCKSPSDNSRPLSLSASDVTALEDTTPLTPLAPLSPLKSLSNGLTLLNQPTFVKLQD
jgi:biopolymer transport protein ExbD